MFRILTEKLKPRLWLPGLLACAFLQAAAASAATIELAKTAAAVNAVAYDDVANRLYFVDENGALWRLQLTPACEAAPDTCQVTGPVATPLGVPVDIKVNSAAGIAYVSNRDGILWKVDLNGQAPVTPVQVTKGVGLAALFLAPEINAAFVSETQGDFSRVDLSTGTKTVIAHMPFGGGLTVNAARTFAYVITRARVGFFNGTINEIDLATGKTTRTLGSFSTFYGFLAWTDTSEHALYALVSNTGDVDLKRVDLMTSETSQVAHFGAILNVRQLIAPVRSLAVNPSGSGLYLGGYNSVLRLPLSLSPAPNDKTVFLSIGNIPVERISIVSPTVGMANTSSTSGAVFKVSDSPFGGTLDIFGNLTALVNSYGADRYQILVQGPRPGAPFVPIQASWTMYYWNDNVSPGHYEPRLVAPIDSVGTYLIPPEYGSPATAPFWSPTYLMMRYPTTDNGLYTFEIQIFSGATTRILPSALQFLTVLVDNTPPVVTLNSVQDIEGHVVSPCDIVLTGVPNLFKFDLTVSDPNLEGHLLNYTLRAQWGRNQSETVDSGTFPLGATGFEFTPYLAPADANKWVAHCNCAHLFTLQATKRTINGYTHILSASSSEAITINNTGTTCP